MCGDEGDASSTKVRRKSWSSQCGRWDAGAVPQLAAATQQPKTKGPEENASTCSLKPACPKGSQMFLECPFSSSLWGKEANESVPDGKMYCELYERKHRG